MISASSPSSNVTGSRAASNSPTGVALPQRRAEIPAEQDGAGPAAVLLPHRLVEPERRDELVAAQLSGRDVVLAQHQVDDVAGNEAHRHEDDQAGEEQRRHKGQQSAHDIGVHRASPVFHCGSADRKTGVVATAPGSQRGTPRRLPRMLRRLDPRRRHASPGISTSSRYPLIVSRTPTMPIAPPRNASHTRWAMIATEISTIAICSSASA